MQKKHELETQQAARELGDMKEQAETKDRMHSMLAHVHQNPADKTVIDQMDALASNNPKMDLGHLVSEAGSIHQRHLDIPPMVPDVSPERELETQIPEAAEKRPTPDTYEFERRPVR